MYYMQKSSKIHVNQQKEALNEAQARGPSLAAAAEPAGGSAALEAERLLPGTGSELAQRYVNDIHYI